MSKRNQGAYQPIEDYGVIGNLRTVALVGRDGSIDWCCLPELDNSSVFAALLDHQKGGRFRVSATRTQTGSQRYLASTNVLETRFEDEKGRLCLTDFMPLYSSIVDPTPLETSPTLYRLLHCKTGEVEVEVEWSPRFNYARAEVRMEQTKSGFLARAGEEAMVLRGLPANAGEIRDDGPGPVLQARFPLRQGERLALTAQYGAEQVNGGLQEGLDALEGTAAAWREWAHSCEGPERCVFAGPYHEQAVRSALVLKLLTHPDTGAIAAAPTTSLPEEIGGVRNWDYRYAWIRDSAFTAQALFSLGHRTAARDFLAFAQRAAMEGGEALLDLQIMYGLHGETDLSEQTLSHLEGYRGSSPVRIGNGAAKQRQLDIYGELMSAAYELVRLGGAPQPSLMDFLSALADRACEVWREPDSGIWEVRGGPRHFVYSKVMVWVALDRALTMAQRYGLKGNVERWHREREAVRQAILTEGFDEDLGAFVQSFGSKILDASNLLIPVVEFLPFDDPRVQGTLDRTLEQLTENGVVHRYLTEHTDDGLPGSEGAFGLTTFWLVNALALSGRYDEAHELFDGMVGRANHLGLYAEEFEPHTGGFLGNFPQGFSHIGFINSALYLSRAAGAKQSTPAPIGSKAHGEEAGRDTKAGV
jgi:GH15 family glucan-1,4-alpha-glucosidase